MNYLEIAEEQIRRDENKKPSAYQDSEGYWTIGIGRLIDARAGGGLSDEEMEFLFANDIDAAVSTARHFVPKFDLLSETRKAVILNMAFNLKRKLGGFQKFLAAVDEGRYDDAAHEMLNSLWAQQVGMRALRLSQQMASGDQP